MSFLLSVPQLCPATLSVVDDRSGGLSPHGGERGLQRCPSSLSTKAQSVGTYRQGNATGSTEKKRSVYSYATTANDGVMCDSLSLHQMSDALEGTASPFAGKDPGQSSPMSDRKKNRRKKSMNQKGEAAVGQAEGNATRRASVSVFHQETVVCMKYSCYCQ